MVFSSPTVNYPPLIPPDFDAPMEPQSISDLQNPQWAVSSLPQLAYCVRRNARFTGPILGRLNMTFKYAPLHRVHESWTLSPPVAQSWQSLENALLWMADFLLGNCPVLNQRLLPLDFKKFRVPSSFGYLGVYRDELHCRACIMRSRNAFLPLMALCSMAIATWSRRDAAQVSVPENAFPNWGMALKAQKVDIDWIADIMASPIADMTLKTRRVGVLVRADGPNLWWGQLPCMIRFNVPIWIYWGTIEVPRNTPHATPAMLAHKPSMDDIKNADYLMSETGGRDGHPLVEGGGGQLYGETWKEMFARRSVEDETLRAEETPLQMEARLRRKELSLLCKAPGLQCRGVTVFEWVECPEPRYRGEFVRYRVSRWQVGDVWDRYTDAQKRYDDYRNEWDLCRQFDSDDMDDQLYAETSQDTSFIDHRALLPSLPPSAESCNDVTRQAHVAYSVPHITDPPRPALSEEILRNRYGLILPADASYELRSQPPLSQAKLEKLFGFCPKSLPLTLRNPLSDFAIGLMRNADFLSTMWDLRARNGSCIKTKTSTHVSRYLRLSVDGSRGEVYRVEGQGTGPAHWELIVEDPVSVMQLLRLRGPQSTQYLFQHLVSQGSTCSTVYFPGDTDLSIQHAHSLCSASSRNPTLGWTRRGYEFNISNYRHYEHKRGELLKRKYGRAAWLAGGIVWRLAVEAMGIEWGFSGPSNLVYQYGLWHEYEGRGIGGDDALSEEEEGIICGLYKVYTDDSGRQTEDASWWPKQSVWKRCGLYVGYWSEDCERWFQLRLQGIKSCKEQPKNAAAWKDALKYYQNDSRTILAQLSRGASNFLA